MAHLIVVNVDFWYNIPMRGGEMMKYAISYDLNQEDKNYAKLIEAIKNASNGIYCNPCKSTWFIQSNHEGAEKLYQALRKSIDENDFIVIAQVTNDVSGFTEKQAATILHNHFRG